MVETNYKYPRVFIACVMIFSTQCLHAEVVVDGTIAVTTEITPTDGTYAINESHGKVEGTNQFHSFTEFNISDGEVAKFSGPDGVKNIISRVTGGNASTINGSISSDITGVNMWLMNPEGILFGENATLDIQGSFHATTADYIKFRDGSSYDAIDSSVLGPTDPYVFGFIEQPTSLSGTIEVTNSKLAVNEGESISLVGSDISLKGSLLEAPGGIISVVSINEEGEVIYSDSVGLDSSSTQKFGPVSVDSSSFKVNGEQRGNLLLKGGDIDINLRNTDFVSGVTSLKTSFPDSEDLLEKPCELADFYNQGKMSFTVDLDEEDTEYGLKTKKIRRGPIGGDEKTECL